VGIIPRNHYSIKRAILQEKLFFKIDNFRHILKSHVILLLLKKAKKRAKTRETKGRLFTNGNKRDLKA